MIETFHKWINSFGVPYNTDESGTITWDNLENKTVPTKAEIDAKKISTAEDAAIAVYQEALDSMNEADFFYASKKFSEAEGLLPQTEWAAKSSLMSSYCLYAINFYDEAVLKLERFIKI